METFQYERAVICFSKAITLQPDQTQLYVGQAEAYLQLCDFQSALVCYRKASVLEPRPYRDRLAVIFYLQGQHLLDRCHFAEALEAFSQAAQLKPGCRAYTVRSLVCLTAAGHHTEALQLVNDWMASDSLTSDLYVLRARLHKRLHQDVRSALALNPSCPEAGALLQQLRRAAERARQKAVDRAVVGQLPEALCMINVALDNCPRDAQLYLFRGILYRRLKDFIAAIEDLVQAVELSGEEEEEVRGQVDAVRDSEDRRASLEEQVGFQLVLTYNDFAVELFGRGQFAEATLLLNKAIEEEKDQPGLYLNRGDYQQAEEMMSPDDPDVRLRLAVLHNTLGLFCFQGGRFQEAADMFSLALQYNPRAAQYYENRSKAFRKLMNTDGARRDLICLLVLDPTNEELPPMLMSLFPGCSAANVLSGPEGRAVRAQLMETEQQRLNETLQRLSLTDVSAESPSGEKLKLPGNEERIQMMVKNLQQAVESGHNSIQPPRTTQRAQRDPASPAGPSESSRTQRVQRDPASPTRPNKSSRTQRVQRDPASPTGPSEPSGTQRVQRDPASPTGPNKTNRSQQAQRDPTSPTGTSESNGTQRVQRDPTRPTGTSESNRNERVQQEPASPAGPSESNGTQRVQRDPTSPTGTSESNGTQQVQQEPASPTGTSESNRNQRVQQDPTSPAGPNKSNRNQQVRQDPTKPTGPSKPSGTQQVQQDPASPAGPSESSRIQ
ncbi:tetratricopeptide repeat protein 16-like [Echeneis naucrates]|uniref:tetratricopeptide repeat protein 16-like n=1 Tax=Echeneis naucrates TaxID=173247 RepID=UPI0011137944|nr:tetratricopeptide repeat protein 16 [Echeneis naucrates]